MSVDLEDRLERGLADLARQAPVPDDWPTLGTPVVAADRRPDGRHHVVAALVAAAAVLVVVATVAFVADRDPWDPPTRVAATPPSTNAIAGSSTLGGYWSATGPRLSDEQLAWLVELVTLDDGATVVVPRSGSGEPDTGPDVGRRVIGVEVARTTPAEFGLLAPASGAGHLSIDQHLMILQYLASLRPGTTVQSTGPVVTMAIVRTDPQPGTVAPGADCGGPAVADHPACTGDASDYLWFFVGAATMPTTRTAITALPRLDVLAGLDPIGTWTPAIAPSVTTEPGTSTSVPSALSPSTSDAAPATTTILPVMPPFTSSPSSVVPSRPGVSLEARPSSTVGSDPSNGHP